MTAPAQPAKRGLAAIPLPAWIVAGALAGIVTGVVLGDRTTVLEPLGSAYSMMLRVAVYPYLISALIYGLGRLTPTMASRLFRAGCGVYLFLWCTTLATIWLLARAIPPTLAPSILIPETAQGGTEILEWLIPANLFEALARDYVPAIAVFAIVYGIAIQKIERKSALFEVLEAIQAASATLWGWTVGFVPIGVFALFAVAAGTLEPSRLAGVLLYVALTLVGTLLLALLVLPAAIAAIAPVRYRQVMRELQPALVISLVTGLSVVALPFVQRAAERIATEAGCPDDEERSNVIRAMLALSYVLAPLGNYFVYLLMLYAAYAYRVPITADDQLLLPMWTLLTGLGSPNGIVDAVLFLTRWLHLPSELMDLFLETLIVTRYGQALLSVMGFSFATILVPLVYFGRARLQAGSAAFAVAVTVVSIGLAVAGGLALRPLLPQQGLDDFHSFTIDPRLADGLEVVVLRAPPAESPAVAIRDPTPAAIRADGVLRVGYKAGAAPFSYWNRRDQLVGFDISFAYELARDLGVRLELVPFEWETMQRDLMERRFDVAMSGIIATDERLRTLEPSHSYFHSPVALITRSDRARSFLDRTKVEEMPNLKLAVFEDPALMPMAKALFPKADVKTLRGQDVEAVLAAGRVDGVIWSLQQAGAWAAAHPGFTAVSLANWRGPLLFSYLMPPGAEIFRHYLDEWWRLKTADGFRANQLDYWMKGKQRSDRPARWNLLDALTEVDRKP